MYLLWLWRINKFSRLLTRMGGHANLSQKRKRINAHKPHPKVLATYSNLGTGGSEWGLVFSIICP